MHTVVEIRSQISLAVTRGLHLRPLEDLRLCLINGIARNHLSPSGSSSFLLATRTMGGPPPLWLPGITIKVPVHTGGLNSFRSRRILAGKLYGFSI